MFDSDGQSVCHSPFSFAQCVESVLVITNCESMTPASEMTAKGLFT